MFREMLLLFSFGLIFLKQRLSWQDAPLWFSFFFHGVCALCVGPNWTEVGVGGGELVCCYGPLGTGSD